MTKTPSPLGTTIEEKVSHILMYTAGVLIGIAWGADLPYNGFGVAIRVLSFFCMVGALFTHPIKESE